MQSRIAYGVHAVRSALARGCVERIFLQQDLGAKRLGRLADDLSASRVPVTLSSSAELRQMTGTEKHQGVAARIHGARPLSEREACEYLRRIDNPLVLMLDGVQDPRNFGSILRTANAAGADLVATARSRNVGLTPVVSKVASGAAEVQPLAEVGNLARLLAAVQAMGMRIIGTDEHASTSLFDVDLTGPTVFVLGGEGTGMRRLTRDHCDLVVGLPMSGVVGSLNVAVAAGICLYECRRQRGDLAPGGAVR